MKKYLWILGATIVGCGFFVLGYFSQDISLRFHKPRTLARVNGIEITDLDLKRELMFLRVSDSNAVSDSTREDVLDRLVNDALIVQEARRLKITVPEAEVNSRAAAAWEGYTPGEVQQMLKEHRLTAPAWAEMIRRQMLIEAALQRVVNDQARVGEDEVDAYYWSHLLEFYRPERVRARQIVVDTQAQAQELKRRLDAGEDFQQLAAKFSRGPERDAGGDLGWVTRTELPQSFSQVLFRLRPGEISSPVSTEYGYHLFKAEETERGGKIPAEEAKQMVTEDLKREKADQLFQSWIEDLRSRAKIILVDTRGGE